MRIMSSTQSAIPNDDSFETLLKRQKERLQSIPHVAESRPNGELQMSWKLDTSKKQSNADSSKMSSQASRRSASKNVFRKMRK